MTASLTAAVLASYRHARASGCRAANAVAHAAVSAPGQHQPTALAADFCSGSESRPSYTKASVRLRLAATMVAATLACGACTRPYNDGYYGTPQWYADLRADQERARKALAEDGLSKSEGRDVGKTQPADSGCTKIPDSTAVGGFRWQCEGSSGTARAGGGLESIIVTTGQIGQPYEILGQVHTDTKGWVSLGSLVSDSLFRAPLAVAVQATPKVSTAEIGEWLKRAGREKYGAAVDAIINVVYSTDPFGDVAADGLAVRFVKTTAPPTEAKDTESRLKTLESLRRQKLIDDAEYKRKRQEILGDL